MEQNLEVHSIPPNSKHNIVDGLPNKNINKAPNFTHDIHIKEEQEETKNITVSEIKCEPEWENFQTETHPHTTFIKVEPDINEMINDTVECLSMGNINEALYGEWKLKNEEIKLSIEDNEDSVESSPICQENDNKNYTTDENPKTEPKTRNCNIYRCEKCDYETTYKGNLKIHSYKHKSIDELDRFKCNQCPYETVYKRNINRHLLKHTSLKDITRYKCEHCTYMTIYKRSLTVHLNQHTELEVNRKLKCDHCNYKTAVQTKLDRHILKHADPKEVNMFQCEYCDFKTLYKKNLKSHNLKHRSPSEGSRFECKHCVFKTNYKSNFNKHVKKHQEVAVPEVYQKVLKDTKPTPE